MSLYLSISRAIGCHIPNQCGSNRRALLLSSSSTRSCSVRHSQDFAPRTGLNCANRRRGREHLLDLVMVAFSSLRGKATSERLARISKAYANNRPIVQRILNISFVLYVLSTTYYSMSGGGRKDSSKQGKGKTRTGGKPTADGRPERVAVCILLVSVFSAWLIPRILSGRCDLLQPPIPNLEDCYTWDPFQRGTLTTNAFKSPGLQNCNLIIRCSS